MTKERMITPKTKTYILCTFSVKRQNIYLKNNGKGICFIRDLLYQVYSRLNQTPSYE